MIAIPSPRFPAFPVSPVYRIHSGSFLRMVAALVLLACVTPVRAADGWTGLPKGGTHGPAGNDAIPDPASSGAYRPAYGLLWLQIDPDGVAISLDGDYLDKDVWLVSLAPGDHVLRVSKPGFQPRESRFGITAGQNVRLDLKLLPDSGG